jgi:predicted glycosyltransferase
VSRPSLLFHCHHTLGLGHLSRSFALTDALAERFRVTLLSGGAVPAGLQPPAGVELVRLPALDGAPDAPARRRRLVLAHAERVRPAAIVVELFPFGRKTLAGELLPLLEWAGAARPRPVAVCSVRDILVGRGEKQERHDERAAAIANRHLDAVLVHADRRFAVLDESFRPRTPLAAPVHYTGFVVSARADAAPVERRGIVVSAGGGLVGEHLLRTAVAAQRLAWPRTRTPMTVIAGPFLPEAAWRGLLAAGRGVPGLHLRRFVPDLLAELRRATGSVSQCGYNTALDVLRSGAPALMVPFSAPGEDEQTRRAARLEALGAVRVLPEPALDAPALARALAALPQFRPAPLDLALDGARASADLLARLAARAAHDVPRPQVVVPA